MYNTENPVTERWYLDHLQSAVRLEAAGISTQPTKIQTSPLAPVMHNERNMSHVVTGKKKPRRLLNAGPVITSGVIIG